MENLIIERTESLPKVEMLTNGNITIEGRALPEDAVRFFQPINTWIKEFSGDTFKLTINLEYFNTSVSKQLHDFFIILNNKPASHTIEVLWKYEEGDDEMLESGEIYEELFPRIKFDYHQYEEQFDD